MTMTPCRFTFELNGRRFHVDLEEPMVSIGRSHGCKLVLPSESISRRHAEVRYEDGGWIIYDLGAKNGVVLNDQRVERARLRNGDRIRLGNVVLSCEMPEEPQAGGVVFDDSAFSGSMTGFIDMGQLNTLVAGATRTPAPAVPATEAPPADPKVGTAMGAALQQSAWVLKLFNEAAEALLSSENLDEMLVKVMDLVFNNLPAQRGFICLYDEATKEMTPKVLKSRDPDQTPDFVISRTIANAAIKKNRSVLVQDAPSDSEFGQVQSIVMMRVTSVMCAPLYTEGKVIGFIYVDSQSSEEPFAEPHLQVLSTLAVLSAVAVEQTRLRDEVEQEQRIRSRLARYSSPNVVDRLVQEAGESEDLDMIADEAEISVLFADLSGFTTMSERLSAPEVTQVLNTVFAKLTTAVFEFEGTLDKFIGDEIMVFFGAPIAQPDHAERAVRAALRMLEHLAEFNSTRSPEDQLQMSIGLNSGQAVVGDIGSPQRKDYTVIGDAVNTAKRLESFAADPGQVVVGPLTYELIQKSFLCEPLEELMLKGKQHPVQPYRVVGPK